MGRDAWLVVGSVLIAAGVALLIGIWRPPRRHDRRE